MRIIRIECELVSMILLEHAFSQWVVVEIYTRLTLKNMANLNVECIGCCECVDVLAR